MAKLTFEELQTEVEQKGFKLIDAKDYKNLKSPILVICEKGHRIETNMETFRKNCFVCPICDGTKDFIVTKKIPVKTGFRIIAFDNATEKMGVGIFDDGELVFCDLYIFQGDLITRLCKIKSLLETIIIPKWEPDFMVFEDIQYQHNIMTFKVLAMLLGICETAARSAGIEYSTVLASVWRSSYGVAGKSRTEEKKISKQKVKELYNIDVGEDVAEAILIGKYASRIKKSKKLF